MTDFDRTAIDRAIAEDDRRHQAADIDDGYISAYWLDRIRQGYFEAPTTDHVMVRLNDTFFSSEAMLSRKRGHGRDRTFEYRRVGFDEGKWLYDACPYKLQKSRHVMGEWIRLDEFEGPLAGLFTLELHGDGIDGPLPDWIIEAREVTDSLTNFHLAKLARALTDSGATFEASRHLKRVRKIVLTGGPGAGKSGVMKKVIEAFGDRIHCVPEVATIIMGQVGARPPVDDPVALRTFQRTMTEVQRLFEAVSANQAAAQGKILLMDRGTLDNAAYLKGHLAEFERIIGTTRAAEAAVYDLVICLDAPSREVFEANKSNNPDRLETPEQAVALADLTVSAWAGHPNLRFIPDRGTVTWEQKCSAVLEAIRTFLGA